MIKSLAKKAAAFPGLHRLPRYINRYKPTILMFHGLSQNPETQDWTQVDPDDFRRQMKYLKDNYRIASLGELVGMLESGDVDPHTVAVTFDDGYKSNIDLALPILQEFEIPATIFVTSGFVMGTDERQRYLWPDFITALLKTKSGEILRLDEHGLGQYDLSSMRNIYIARSTICERLKTIATAETERIISKLFSEYGGAIDHDRFGDYSSMTPEEVKSLTEVSLITIGAHSRSHPILSRLDGKELEDEIIGSKRDLEELTGVDIRQFAYPNGRWQDINSDVIEITSRSFDCAVMTEAGINPVGQNKYLLRRIGIGRNLDIGQFRLMISGAFYTSQRPVGRLEKTGQG